MFAYGAQPPVQDDDDDDPTVYKGNKGKQLPFHGNRQTMNLNPLILTNIQGSPYYKVELFKKRSFLEVVDEIYYKVDHLEPWERGSRGGAGMRTTGMCGGVRGVSAGGIVSSAFCLLYKLFTLKLTEKQAECLINHQDSPYIRGLGFMYLRFTQPPGDLWDWFEPYMDDQEQIDVKAGGGKNMAMGDFLKLMLTKLEWFDTRFPRIPATVEKMMRERMEELENRGGWGGGAGAGARANQAQEVDNWQNGGEERNTKQRSRSPSSGVGKSRDDKSSRGRSREKDRSKDRDNDRRRDRSKDEDRRDRSKDEDRKRKKDRSRDRSRERDRSKDKERKKRKDRSRDRSRSKNRSRSKDRTSSKRKKDRSRDRSRENRRSKESDRKRGKDRSRERSRSKDKDSKRKKDRSRSSDRSKKVKSKRDRSGTRDRERKNGREKEDSEYADQLKRFKKLKRKEKRSRSR